MQRWIRMPDGQSKSFGRRVLRGLGIQLFLKVRVREGAFCSRIYSLMARIPVEGGRAARELPCRKKRLGASFREVGDFFGIRISNLPQFLSRHSLNLRSIALRKPTQTMGTKSEARSIMVKSLALAEAVPRWPAWRRMRCRAP